MRQRNDRVAELEAELERRLKELEQREAALKKIAAAVMKTKPPAAQPERRRSELEETTRAAEPRPRGLFGRRLRDDQPAPAVEPPVLLPPHVPEPEPEPEPAAAPAPVAFEGRPTLPQLEHLADEAERRGSPEADEWQVYVRLLREHSWVDGTIPPQFDDILRDVFGATF